jgi:hypothetical protein
MVVPPALDVIVGTACAVDLEATHAGAARTFRSANSILR